ncbi:hypothetical protein HK101_010588 [Irineochytrium annulatum]|nr:hypothetical protein HK101_010588 [Irineochytrium annulatum]
MLGSLRPPGDDLLLICIKCRVRPPDLLCPHCRSAAYCSDDCLKDHRAAHKPSCARLLLSANASDLVIFSPGRQPALVAAFREWRELHIRGLIAGIANRLLPAEDATRDNVPVIRVALNVPARRFEVVKTATVDRWALCESDREVLKDQRFNLKYEVTAEANQKAKAAADSGCGDVEWVDAIVIVVCGCVQAFVPMRIWDRAWWTAGEVLIKLRELVSSTSIDEGRYQAVELEARVCIAKVTIDALASTTKWWNRFVKGILELESDHGPLHPEHVLVVYFEPGPELGSIGHLQKAEVWTKQVWEDRTGYEIVLDRIKGQKAQIPTTFVTAAFNGGDDFVYVDWRDYECNCRTRTLLECKKKAENAFFELRKKFRGD